MSDSARDEGGTARAGNESPDRTLPVASSGSKR